MKIISLQAENIKRIMAVYIEPDGSLVQITGGNGHGKTSVLDSIWWALKGVKNIQTTPIRQGEEEAVIRLDLGKYKVTRTFKAQDSGEFTTRLKVTTPDGAQFSSPQQILDEILGELTFDPLEFTRMKPKDQIAAMRKLVADFDFDENKKNHDDAYAERTFVNRNLKKAEITADEIAKDLPEQIPQRVNPDELMQHWQDAEEKNKNIEQRAENRKRFKEQRNEIAEKLAELQAKLTAADEKIASWPPMEEKIDAESIRAKLSLVNETNEIAERAKKLNEQKKEVLNLRAQSDSLTADIEALNKAAKDAIAAARLPISGLEMTVDGVKLDGVPFNQASDAQQLQTSIAVAMALNPTLKVIRVRDGSLLDENGMKMVAQMAEEKGYQIWLEKVDTSGEVGFVIDNGHLKQPEQQKEQNLFG